MGPALRVSKVCVERGGRRLLHEVSFEVHPGEVVALIGPNGAGKTTLLETVVGLRRHLGEVLPASLFWLPDEAAPPAELEVAAQLELGRRFGGCTAEEARVIAGRLGLEGLRARCGTLSRGEARRVLLHGALCCRRPLLVMDEPLGTFDPLQLREIGAQLRERAAAGQAVLLSVHQLHDAQKVADRYVLLSQGRALACGALGELRQLAGLLEGTLEDVFLALLGKRDAA